MSKMTCADLEEALGDWYDGLLENSVIVIIEKHLGDCEHCGLQVALYRATVALCRRLPEEPIPMSDTFAAKLRGLLMADGA